MNVKSKTGKKKEEKKKREGLHSCLIGEFVAFGAQLGGNFGIPFSGSESDIIHDRHKEVAVGVGSPLSTVGHDDGWYQGDGCQEKTTVLMWKEVGGFLPVIPYYTRRRWTRARKNQTGVRGPPGYSDEV